MRDGSLTYTRRRQCLRRFLQPSVPQLASVAMGGVAMDETASFNLRVSTGRLRDGISSLLAFLRDGIQFGMQPAPLIIPPTDLERLPRCCDEQCHCHILPLLGPFHQARHSRRCPVSGFRMQAPAYQGCWSWRSNDRLPSTFYRYVVSAFAPAQGIRQWRPEIQGNRLMASEWQETKTPGAPNRQKYQSTASRVG
ncbi:hypothetical protein BU26DRAFT_13550 [Trematosphaeria pertusa]|uniref:Uncharacterized protein n=1 Tax=Trematosphaeria pertusa TaxID=390896 RepID=A0A6A6J1H4_9PLEO|nr:uncharacterized protein BU26DRAFT_13550 [Trematosphaeria pertusa]KAF2256042.1 hypothetical protein BU26DRAFT_13550 [Trematosphaeria pertusa]